MYQLKIKKFKFIFSFALALGICANSFLMAGAVGSDDESDSDGTSGTSSSTHSKAKTKEKKTQSKTVVQGIGEVHRELVAAAAAPLRFEVAAAAAAAEAEEPIAELNTDAMRKERILANYQPNLAELQEIGFGVTTTTPDGREVEQRVKTDVHFRGDDGKEYLLFYNNHIAQLRELIFKKLKQKIENNSIVLFDQKGGLMDVAQRSVSYSQDVSFFKWSDLIIGPPIPWISVWNKFVSPNNWDIVENARMLSHTCANLNYTLKQYGRVMENSDTPCALFMYKDGTANTDQHTITGLIDTPEAVYKNVEKDFYRIANSDMSDREVVVAMDKCMNRLERIVNPRASDRQTIDFCFTLNRASYYLSRLERDFQSKDLATLEAMDRLRRKINRLSLEYRFIFAQNESPILGIRMDRCKIIVETEAITMVFLDRNETKKFQEVVEKALDRKAANITGDFSFKPLSGEELRRLACDLKPESYQGMIDEMDRQLVDMQAESAKQTTQAIAEGAKVGMQIVDGIVNLETGGASSALAAVTKQFNQHQVKEYLAVEKSLKESETKEEIDPMQRVLHPSFDRPRDITVDQAPSDLGPAPEARVDRTGFPKKAVVVHRQDNPTELGKVMKEFNLNPQDIDKLTKSFEHFIEARRIDGHIRIRKNQKEYIKKIKEGQEDFINLFKLYIQLIRCNFVNRTNFGGSLITEDRSFETRDGRLRTMREYIVREVQRLEEFA